MSLEFLENIYDHIRNTLVWFIVYFILQAFIWAVLAILIWIYPQALFVLVSIFFFVIAIVSLYFAIMFIGYLKKVRKFKNFIK